MAVIVIDGSLPRRDNVADVHDHVAEGLREGRTPAHRRVGRQKDAVIAEVSGGEGLADQSHAVVREIGDDANRGYQAIADVGVPARLDGEIPGAGRELQFIPAIQRHPVAIFTAHVRGERALIHICPKVAVGVMT